MEDAALFALRRLAGTTEMKEMMKHKDREVEGGAKDGGSYAMQTTVLQFLHISSKMRPFFFAKPKCQTALKLLLLTAKWLAAIKVGSSVCLDKTEMNLIQARKLDQWCSSAHSTDTNTMNEIFSVKIIRNSWFRLYNPDISWVFSSGLHNIICSLWILTSVLLSITLVFKVTTCIISLQLNVYFAVLCHWLDSTYLHYEAFSGLSKHSLSGASFLQHRKWCVSASLGTNRKNWAVSTSKDGHHGWRGKEKLKLHRQEIQRKEALITQSQCPYQRSERFAASCPVTTEVMSCEANWSELELTGLCMAK